MNQVTGRVGNREGQPVNGLPRADQHRNRQVATAALRRQKGRDGARVERVCADPVYGVRRQHDQPPALHRTDRGGDAGGALSLVGTCENLCHRVIFLRAVTKRGRSANLLRAVTSKKKPLRTNIATTAADAASSCSTAINPPSLSQRPASTEIAGMNDVPSGPPNRACGGSCSATSGSSSASSGR